MIFKTPDEMEKDQSFTGPHRFSMDAWIRCAPFERLLHMTIVEAADGKAVLTMPFLLDFAQGAGLMHGGALVSLADTAVVMAIKSLLPPQTHFATIAMETKFLYPVKKGRVTAKAEVSKQEGRNLRGKATLYDDEGFRNLAAVFIVRLIRGGEISFLVPTVPAGPFEQAGRPDAEGFDLEFIERPGRVEDVWSLFGWKGSPLGWQPIGAHRDGVHQSGHGLSGRYPDLQGENPGAIQKSSSKL